MRSPHATRGVGPTQRPTKPSPSIAASPGIGSRTERSSSGGSPRAQGKRFATSSTTGDHRSIAPDSTRLRRDTRVRPPSLLTTQTAENVHREAGVLDDVCDVDHYGNLKGSNERESERLGAVIGSRHFGDPDRSDAETRGRGLSYGGVGDDILRHAREHETL